MALPRLIFITGKGGTGKSTVAAALAIALSRRNATTVADLDRRLSVARLLGAQLNGSGTAQASDHLKIVSLTPRAEIETFIDRIVPLKAISGRMLKSRTFGYVTAALPGLEAFLMLERLRLMAGKAAAEDCFAVIDAPATGSAIELLSVAQGVKQLAPVGMLNRLAGEVDEFLTDTKRFGVILTVRPEELALREAIEAAAILREKLAITCVAAVLNGVNAALFTSSEIAQLRSLKGHARLARHRRASAEFAASARRELKCAGLPIVELPALFHPALAQSDLEMLAGLLETELLQDECASG
jgi:Mrp family chromosome partitioning ATPase